MIPTFETKRLVIRPYVKTDADKVEPLAGNPKVAETTVAIPHPYPKGLAASWISKHEKKAIEIGSYTFAVVLKSTSELLGTLTFRVDIDDNKAELGYWFGVPYWGNGYCTEAARRIIEFGFNELKLNKIWASVMTKNPASMKILTKLDFEKEGVFKQDIMKSGNYEDMVYYGLLRQNYQYNR